MESKTKWPRDIDIQPIPGCRLGTRRRCTGGPCGVCGWSQKEYNRRKALLNRNGLTVDPTTGLKRLVLPAR
jgi:hypothetical protein